MTAISGIESLGQQAGADYTVDRHLTPVNMPGDAAL
jgi:hypothetical protein